MLKLLPVLFLIVSCTTPKGCSCEEDVGPLDSPAPTPKEAVELIYEKEGSTVLVFNPAFFPDCVALEVTYDSVNYGIILPGTPLYVTQATEETHEIDVTCLDDLGLPTKTVSMTMAG